LSLRRRGRRTR